nr:Os03g0264150 [Ipomoea batatas]
MKRIASASGYSVNSGSTISRSLPSSLSFHVCKYVINISSPKAALLLLLPLMISRRSTPKLYTSTFFVSCPSKAYSGARYPLHTATRVLRCVTLSGKSFARPKSPILG